MEKKMWCLIECICIAEVWYVLDLVSTLHDSELESDCKNTLGPAHAQGGVH